MIFAHGLTFCGAAAFDLPLDGRSLCQFLAERGFTCLVVDHRGFGRSSSLEPSDPFTLDERVADLRAVHEYARERGGDISLVGLSLGCGVVARLAAERDASISSVVLLGVPKPLLPDGASPHQGIDEYDTAVRENRTYFLRSFTRHEIRTRIMTGEQALIPEAVFDAFFTTAFESMRVGSSDVVRVPISIAPRRDIDRTAVASLRKPALVIRGERDEISTAESMRELQVVLPAQLARFVTFPNRKHDLFLYPQPEEVMETIHSFLVETIQHAAGT